MSDSLLDTLLELPVQSSAKARQELKAEGSRIEAASALSREREKRESEAGERPPSPAHSHPTSSEEDSSEVMEDFSEAMGVPSEDIP